MLLLRPKGDLCNFLHFLPISEEVEKSLRETPLPLPLGQIGNFVGQEAMSPVDCEIVAPPANVHVAQEESIGAEISLRLAQMALCKEQPPQRRIVTLPPAEVVQATVEAPRPEGKQHAETLFETRSHNILFIIYFIFYRIGSPGARTGRYFEIGFYTENGYGWKGCKVFCWYVLVLCKNILDTKKLTNHNFIFICIDVDFIGSLCGFFVLCYESYIFSYNLILNK